MYPITAGQIVALRKDAGSGIVWVNGRFTVLDVSHAWQGQLVFESRELSYLSGTARQIRDEVTAIAQAGATR